ncbi:MAG: hypothetical protein NVSMB3_07020 [Acidobacteriaceae bacterium]
MVKQFGVEAVRLLVDEEVRGDAVARVELGGNARVLELVRHGHRIHEAGDRLVIEDNVAAMESDYTASEQKASGICRVGVGGFGSGRCGRLRRSRLGGRPAACQGKSGNGQKQAVQAHERYLPSPMIMAWRDRSGSALSPEAG